jgi:hypothetical protein
VAGARGARSGLFQDFQNSFESVQYRAGGEPPQKRDVCRVASRRAGHNAAACALARPPLSGTHRPAAARRARPQAAPPAGWSHLGRACRRVSGRRGPPPRKACRFGSARRGRGRPCRPPPRPRRGPRRRPRAVPAAASRHPRQPKGRLRRVRCLGRPCRLSGPHLSPLGSPAPALIRRPATPQRAAAGARGAGARRARLGFGCGGHSRPAGPA